jgi:GSH-dependent disulfide-bond oxidoreductase
MIDLHFLLTPNGKKIAIVPAETRPHYRIFPVDINKGDQVEREFLEISPNNKAPAFVERDARDPRPPR